MQNLWQSCLRQLEKELPAQQFNTWIRPLAPATEALGELHLVAPNRFVLQWVKERFLGRIETMLTEQAGQSMRVVLDLPVAGEERDVPPPAPRPKPAAGVPGAAMAARPQTERRPGERSAMSTEFTFESFVQGKANQLARAAAVQVAENPGVSYNPLFVYGGSGLGKTHLLHAIGNHVVAHQPTARLRYLHANQYITDVVRAYQQKSFDAFKRYYHSLDLLLIDDIQFFTGKDRTQEEFFYAFNALVEAHKQIVITCDTYPRDVAGIDDRLKTRFSWGLTVAVEPPEQEMRVAIVLKKAEAVGIRLGEEVAFFIAKHVRSNVRELEGALKNVLAFATFNGKEVTVEVAREALKDLLSAHNRQISIENIQRTVAEFYKLKVADLHAKKRSRNVARPRQMAMALAKELTEMSLPEIGDAFGNRDHTTVLHACRTIAALRSKDNDLNRDFHVLEQTLKG
ncbi:MAG: chromosomal replication initiator protein DnaA [Burkholderiales bacterium]